MKWRECQFQGGEVPSLSSVPVFSTEGVVDSWRVSMLCAGAVVNAAGATMEREVFEWAEERTENRIDQASLPRGS